MVNSIDKLIDKIFTVNEANFNSLALQIFHFQYQNNSIYDKYVNALQIDVSKIKNYTEIPFLPISFFKTHKVISAKAKAQTIFESSGTTGMFASKHFVTDLSIYKKSFIACFEHFFGPTNKLCIIGLLPSYLERNNSSLVYMVNDLIAKSENPKSGFYLNEYDKLAAILQELENENIPTILFGVTFALLDFAEKIKMHLKNVQIIETGGMKGRHKEMTRHEVHEILKNTFSLQHIYSEYGMTELLSQAYLLNANKFVKPNWMQVLVRDINDPFDVKKVGKGAINIIDLANINSCSFIATDDIGEVFTNGNFTIDGRLDNSDLRGCSLMTI